MRYLVGLLISLLLLVPPQTLQAQGPEQAAPDRLQPTVRFAHLTAEDGLAQNSIQAVLQDRDGFIWIATRNGLSHFDGYQITTYRHMPGNPHSLSDSDTTSLLEDRDGNLWIGTVTGGVNRLDRHQRTFTTYRPNPTDPNSLGGHSVLSIYQDRAGLIWLGEAGEGTFSRFDPATERFTRYRLPPETPSKEVWKILEDREGYLWLATSAALVRFDPQQEQFKVYVPREGEQHLSAIHIDEQGMMWVGGLTGLYRFDPAREAFSKIAGSPHRIDDLLVTRDGKMWIGTFGEGLHQFDPVVGRFTGLFRHDPTDPDSLSDDQIFHLYEDAAGVLWIGSNNGGLNLLDPLDHRFSYYRHHPLLPSSLAEGRVGAIEGNEEGLVWVGSAATLNQINWRSGKSSQHPTGAADGTISALHLGRSGSLWVGSTLSDVYQFAPTTGEFTPLQYRAQRPPPRSGPPREVRTIYEDDLGALWVAIALDGLYRLDPQSGEGHVFDLQIPGDPSPRPGLWIGGIAADQAGMIWVGYDNSFLARLDPETEQFTYYTPEREQQSGRVETIYVARNGLIWMGTHNGLLRFDPATEDFRRYTEVDGLPTAFVVGIQEDGAGNLWLSTKLGLARYDVQTDTFQSYDASDGLQGNEFTVGAAWQAADGQLFFGGTNGLTAFYPERIGPNPYKPPVRLTEFRLFNEPVPVGGESVLQQPIWATEALTLEHDQTILSFEFAALSYADPAKNRYRYRLEGLESSWNEVDSRRRFANYTTLAPGTYTLRIQGSNDDGVWSDEEATLLITVLPPWWQTAWFRSLLFLAVVSLLYGGYRWRVRAIEQRNGLLEKQVLERTEELAASEARFRGLASATFEAVLVHDAGRILDTNEMAPSLFGYPRARLLGKTLNELFSPESQELVRQLVQGSAEASYELMAITEDGCRIPVEVRCREMRAPGQERPLQVVVIRDLTERRQIEGQKQRLATLEERERIGRELHDDLGQVMGYVNTQVQTAQGLLEEGQHLQAQATLGQLAEVVQEAHHDVRQYILGIRTAAPTPLDFRSTLEQYLAQLQQRHGFTVGVNWPDELELGRLAPEVETQLLRIIQEALTNARKYAGVARARLLFTAHADALQVIIADDGRGFDSREVPEGHFGLEIMRERAEAVDGSLVIRSTPGQGTEVIVRLPLVLEQEINEAVRGLRVLLVDDHPLYLEGLRNMLRARGVHVVGMAQDGLEAQKLAKSLHPDVILMDVDMPRMGGLEATRYIKAALPEIKIVMLTVAAEEETLFGALKAGASGYLLKSLNRRKFFALLSEVMRGETVLSPALAARVLEEFSQHKPVPSPLESDPQAEETDVSGFTDLTERQQEVLDLLVQNMSNKEIAARLYVTEQTVKYHVGQILKRLQLRSRYELTHYIQEQGSLPHGSDLSREM